MWPWNRQHREIERAHQRLDRAVGEAARAEDRAKATQRLVIQSRAVSARLRHEIDRNGWTEMLQHAMRGR